MLFRSGLMSQLISEGMNDDALTHRLRSISNNAIREAMFAIGRGNLPWTDDDSRRGEMIFKILHLVRPNDIMEENESLPLVAAQQVAAREDIVNAERAVAKIKVRKNSADQVNQAAVKALSDLNS